MSAFTSRSFLGRWLPGPAGPAVPWKGTLSLGWLGHSCRVGKEPGVGPAVLICSLLPPVPAPPAGQAAQPRHPCFPAWAPPQAAVALRGLACCHSGKPSRGHGSAAGQGGSSGCSGVGGAGCKLTASICLFAASHLAGGGGRQDRCELAPPCRSAVPESPAENVLGQGGCAWVETGEPGRGSTCFPEVRFLLRVTQCARVQPESPGRIPDLRILSCLSQCSEEPGLGQ